MTKAEEIYHRFVQYEWNEIGEGMKKSILDAINEALRQPPVIGSVCDNCGEGKPKICAECYETESNFRESYQQTDP